MPEETTENRKQWKQEAPETLLNVLAEAELSNDSFGWTEEESGGIFITVNYRMSLLKNFTKYFDN